MVKFYPDPSIEYLTVEDGANDGAGMDEWYIVGNPIKPMNTGVHPVYRTADITD